jgi:hypothetical protein
VARVLLPDGPLPPPDLPPALALLFRAGVATPVPPTAEEQATLRRAAALAARDAVLDPRGAGPPGIGNAAADGVLQGARRLSTPTRRIDADDLANDCAAAAREAAKGEPAVRAHGVHRAAVQAAQHNPAVSATWTDDAQTALEFAVLRIACAVDPSYVEMANVAPADLTEETPTA